MLALLATSQAGAAPLRRGVNLTNWFRFPPSGDADALASYISDDAMAGLRRAGFDFVRLAVQPPVIRDSRIDILVAAIRRLQHRGFTVIAGPHFGGDPEPAGLLAFWQRLAPRLVPLDPRLTVPEVMNEPVFPGDAPSWEALQRRALGVIRASLPGRRVLLTGNDWGGIDGLLALRPANDADAIYSFHFYDPTEITALAAYRPGLDRAALARQPFPTTAQGCAEAETTPDRPTRDLIRFVCATRWDADKLDRRIGTAAVWGRRHGVPVLMGEFGASAALNAPARLAWLAAVRRSCERHGIGWALWGYDDSMGFGVRPAPGAPPPRLDPGVLAALGLS